MAWSEFAAAEAGLQGRQGVRIVGLQVGTPLADSQSHFAVGADDGTSAKSADNRLGTVNVILGSLTGVNKRFSNGLKLVQTGGTVTGATLDANVYYRTP